MDSISLYEVPLSVNVGPDVWLRPCTQPIVFTLHAYTPLVLAGRSDNVLDTVHYGHLGKSLNDALASRQFDSLYAMAEEAIRIVFNHQEFGSVDAVGVEAEAPKALLQAEGLRVQVTRQRPRPEASPSEAQFELDYIQIKNLITFIIIGVNPPERKAKQRVLTTITFHLHTPAHMGTDTSLLVFQQHEISQRLTEHIESTSFLTLEAYATSVAQLACSLFDPCTRVTIRAQKPSAVSFGHSSAVEITRDRSFFLQES